MYSNITISFEKNQNFQYVPLYSNVSCIW